MQLTTTELPLERRHYSKKTQQGLLHNNPIASTNAHGVEKSETKNAVLTHGLTIL